MDQFDPQIFHDLESFNIKASERLATSYYKRNEKAPLFVVTSKADETFTLYEVNGKKLNKIQTSDHLGVLEKMILPVIKS